MVELQLDFLGVPVIDFLCGVGFLLLSLCYLTTNLCFPVPWKERDINQSQGRVKRRRKGGTFKDQRICQKEAEAGRKLLSILKSPLGHQHYTTHFRQLLCPDPFCEVCNRTTAEVSHLLYLASMEDTAPSQSPLASTAYVTESSSSLFSAVASVHPEDPIPDPLPETSPPFPSILSPNKVTTLSDLFSPSPLGDSLPLGPLPPVDSKFPVDPFPPQLHAFPSLPLHHTQGADPILQPEATLSLVNSPEELSNYVPTFRGTDSSSLAISQFSWWKAHNRNIVLPRLPHYNFQEENVSLHLPYSYLWKNSDTSHMEGRHISFLGLNIQELLERQIKKRMTFQILEKNGKEHGPLIKQKWSEYQFTSSWNSLQSFVDEKDTTAPQTGWGIKDKPEHLRICQHLVYVKTLGENLEHKYSQLFWGLPTLHSESIVATLLVSRSCSSLEPHFVLFNGTCNVPAVKIQTEEPPPRSQSHPPSLISTHSQPFPHMNPQSQTLPLTHVHPLTHGKSPLPILPLSPPSQITDCGNTFHRADPHILHGNKNLEWHVLQKHHEHLWGFNPELQKCQETFCPPAPAFPLVRRFSQAYVPVSIYPGHFRIGSQPQEDLEHHASQRLIPSWNLQSGSSLGSGALMGPQFTSTESFQHHYRHAHSQPSEHQDHSSKDPEKTELTLTGSFYENFPTKFQPRKDLAKNLGHILGKCPLDNPQTVSECYPRNRVSAVSEKKSGRVCGSRNDLGNELVSVSGKNLDLNQMKSMLRLHVSRKFWQITSGRIPIGVCLSWLDEDKALLPPGNFCTNADNKNMSPLVCRVQCQTTKAELPFLDHKTQKVLEAHIIRFRLSQRWGLPLKVLESIKFYMLREAKTWPLPQCDFVSSSTHISEVNSKFGVSRPIIGSSQAFQHSQAETTNPVPCMDHSFPAPSPVAKEEEDTMGQSCDTDYEVTENVQTIEDGNQTILSDTYNIIEKVSQTDTVPEKRDSPEQPTRQDGDGDESKDEMVSSSHKTEIYEGETMVEKNSEHFSTSDLCRQIFKAHELCALQSQSGAVLKTSKLEGSQITNVNVSKVETTLTTESTQPRIRIPEDPIISNLKRRLLCNLACKPQRHAQGYPKDTKDTFLALDNMSSDSSLTHSHSNSSGDLEVFQELHIHLNDKKIKRQQQQESWVPKHVLWNWWDRGFPPVERRMSPLICKRGKLRGEDFLGLEAFRAIRKCHPCEDRRLDEGCKFLSQKILSSESYFKKKLRQFLQWIDFRRKSTCPRSPVKDSTLYMSCGPPEARELMETLGKILEEKMAQQQEYEALELRHQKEELQAQIGLDKEWPDKGQPSKYGVVSGKQQWEGSSPRSCNQEAVSPGPSCLTGVRQSRHGVRAPQKTVSFKDQVLIQSQHPPPFPRPWSHQVPCSCKNARCFWMPPRMLKTVGSDL